MQQLDLQIHLVNTLFSSDTKAILNQLTAGTIKHRHIISDDSRA